MLKIKCNAINYVRDRHKNRILKIGKSIFCINFELKKINKQRIVKLLTILEAHQCLNFLNAIT